MGRDARLGFEEKGDPISQVFARISRSVEGLDRAARKAVRAGSLPEQPGMEVLLACSTTAPGNCGSIRTAKQSATVTDLGS